MHQTKFFHNTGSGEKIDDQKIFVVADLLDKKSKIRNYFESRNIQE